MKLRIAYAKRRYKDKVYVTPLVVTSYRDEQGTARNKTVASLTGLPDHAVRAVEAALKQGEGAALDEYVSVREIAYPGSVVVGPAFVVLTVLKQLGIYDAVISSLPPQQATAVLNIVTQRSKSIPAIAAHAAVSASISHIPLSFMPISAPLS